ncbi:MAG: hypothetical protein GX096_10085 [Clostridiales bacterium]|nr:hypothetical protein [Clostridiales bacterium]
MFTIREYKRAASLEEAYTLSQNRSNVVLGGMLWLKQQNRSVGVAIDLCDLGLDTIEEMEGSFSIGAMVTLRQLELDPKLNAYTHGMIAASVASIVGVQFRNVATVGGSIFGRYGFSDVLTAFLGLGASVELQGTGVMPLDDFIQMPHQRDLLVRIILPKGDLRAVYLSQRNTKTDFPVLTCALCSRNGKVSCAIGARPQRAMLALGADGFDADFTPQSAAAFGDFIAQNISTGTNLRAGAEYRIQLARVLSKRAALLLSAQGEKACK